MRKTTLLTLSLFIAGCQIESCASQEVGSGIARLTIRNAGALTKLIDRDTSCGFGSQAVLSNPKLEGAVGTIGSVTWTIANCTLAFSAPTTALKTCGDVETRVTGKATLSGTKTVKGTLTGNPKSPVIPVDPDAVRFTLQASLEDFVARRPDSQSALTNTSGTLAWSAEPRLAVSASKGVCSIPTSNVTFSDVTYGASTVLVESKGRRFSTDVMASAYSAQVGKRADKENWIAGELTVYGNPVRVAGAALDPDYEAAAFLKSWECVEDLKQPIDFSCPSLDDKVSLGTARMTVSLFGRLADFFDQETTCGFGSAAVQARPVLTGNLGERGASATWSLGAGCTLNFSMPTVVKTDCFGASTLLSGTVTARGTKTVSGIRTGDPAQPLIPTSRDPGRADVSFEFSNLRISDSVSNTAMTVQTGSLSGTIATQTGLDRQTGACSIKTSIATMSQLQYLDAKLVLERLAGRAHAREIGLQVLLLGLQTRELLLQRLQLRGGHLIAFRREAGASHQLLVGLQLLRLGGDLLVERRQLGLQLLVGGLGDASGGGGGNSRHGCSWSGVVKARRLCQQHALLGK